MSKGRIWDRFFWAALTAAALAVAVPTAAVAGAKEKAEIKALKAALADRDRKIDQILQRLERLESAVAGGHQSVSAAPARPPSAAAAPNGATPANDPQTIVAAQSASPGPVIVTGSADRSGATLSVNERELERALDRALTSSGALLLSDGLVEITPSVFFFRNERDTAVLVATPGGVTAGEVHETREIYGAAIDVRAGVMQGVQLEASLPYSTQSVESETRIGFSPILRDTADIDDWGDISVGVAARLLEEGQGLPDIVARLTATFDTSGDEAIPGTLDDNGSLTGSLSFLKRQDPIVFAGALSYTAAFEDGVSEPGDSFGAFLGAYVAYSPDTSLNFGLQFKRQEEARLAGVTIPGSDETQLSLQIGADTVLGDGVSLQVNALIGLTEDTPDFGIIVSMPIRVTVE